MVVASIGLETHPQRRAGERPPVAESVLKITEVGRLNLPREVAEEDEGRRGDPDLGAVAHLDRAPSRMRRGFNSGVGMRRSRSTCTRSTRSRVFRARWPVRAEAKMTGTQRRKVARARSFFSTARAVKLSFSARSHLFTTRITPQPAFHAASATFTS